MERRRTLNLPADHKDIRLLVYWTPLNDGLLSVSRRRTLAERNFLVFLTLLGVDGVTFFLLSKSLNFRRASL